MTAQQRPAAGGFDSAGRAGPTISVMAVRLGIGDFSRMTHLSVKALRHYHDLGLLTPAEIDPASGYRFYEPSQVPVALVIRRFRDLGMPLEEIRQMLQAPDAGARNEVIVAHMQRMESQLAATQAAVASLRSLLEGPPEPAAVEHRSVGAVRALAIRELVARPDLDAWWDGAFGELNAAVAVAAVPPAGPPARCTRPNISSSTRARSPRTSRSPARCAPAAGRRCWTSPRPSWRWPCTRAPWPTWTGPMARWAPTWRGARSARVGRSASITW